MHLPFGPGRLVLRPEAGRPFRYVTQNLGGARAH
jgi:hypothetical protein